MASEEEVQSLMKATENIKHYCIVGLLYSSGIRRGELISLRVNDIDRSRNQVFVRNGKGGKDRVTLLSDHISHSLDKYLKEYKPHYWLFEGPYRKQYSPSSIGAILKKSCKRAGISKNITPHVLRHSFATHLMDRGTDTRIIQQLLGHQSLETTAIYTHVSKKYFQNIRSPLDQIFDRNEL